MDSLENMLSTESTSMQQLQTNLKEIYEDFQVILPYAPYKVQEVPKIKRVLDDMLQNEVEDVEYQNALEEQRQHNSCDLAIVLDCTSSMSTWITKCKEQILVIIKTLKDKFKRSTFRTGFVAYKDYPEVNRIQVFQFIDSDYIKLEQFIAGLTANAPLNTDSAEDLTGGLNAALHRLNWKSKTKNLFIISDAPCHGWKYHNGAVTDSYQDGDPSGLNIEAIIKSMGQKQIDISAIQINTTTNLMYSILAPLYKNMRNKEMIILNLNTLSSSSTVTNVNKNNDKNNANRRDISAEVSNTVLSSLTSFTGTASLSTSKLQKKDNSNNLENQKNEKDQICLKAIQVLQAHKGLLNTQCLSKTELEFSILNLDNIAQKEVNAKYIEKEDAIVEEDEDDEEEKEDNYQDDDEDDNSVKKQSKKSSNKNQKEKTEEDNKNEKLKKKPASLFNLIDERDEELWYVNLKTSKGYALQCACLTPYIEKSESVNWNQPQIKFRKLTSRIKIAKDYFSQGAMRYAFQAFDTSFNLKLVAKLHKNVDDNSNFELMKRDSMSLIASHYFAEEFNSRVLLKINDLYDVPVLLNFVDSSIYEVFNHPINKVKYYFVESLIEGSYQKFNNNAGWTLQGDSTEFNQTSQAFSHFTWQYSKGQLLIVDIQGGEFGILTDPQIHTKNRSKLYGQGDLGYLGMIKFFHTHHCNDYCKKLGLIHPIITKEVPEEFDFFSDYYGLENASEKTEKKNMEKDMKVIEQPKEEQEEEDKSQNKPKKQKKKRGFALKAQYEKEKEIQDKIDEELLKQKKSDDLKEKLKQTLLIQTQCYLCKTCFQLPRLEVIEIKKNKKDILCKGCNRKCSETQTILSCTKCGDQFEISSYFCKMRKQNLIGQCIKCRE